MIISYNWLSEYLPEKIQPEKLSRILTSIGLEVEGLHTYESVKGGLAGLVTGEVLSCEKHPDADKLKITRVNTGKGAPLQIVCGANNVAAGQKVIVAPVNTTIHPLKGEPLTIKNARIRGVDSQGMICAEDEIGIGTSHDGILVLPDDTPVGTDVSQLFPSYEDYIIEIGLTPNRMDAMSHLGVARDICAYLTHHEKKNFRIISPFKGDVRPDNHLFDINVKIEDAENCMRYAGITITGVHVADSPDWLQRRLKVIGLKPINNIVDITNFILHETGQPLHAFDVDKITGKTVVIKKAEAGALFTTLDDKQRKLTGNELVISNTETVMCLAGVYGGADSGVTNTTKNIFLESAWFNPESVRKTSLGHNLRTDAATRFEKGVDIGNTANVLKRAALMVKEICGGTFSGELIDVYPIVGELKTICLKYQYLKKLSGKTYPGDTVKNILVALGFLIAKESPDELWVTVPSTKPDIQIPADIVEEIMRIDGLDNIEIPRAITITPSINSSVGDSALKEKIANCLIGVGFYEIFTNSITNSKYYSPQTLASAVKMINNLSADLDVMRTRMLETGLEVVAHNINRKNTNLMLFELGKTYQTEAVGKYLEAKHLVLYLSGSTAGGNWQSDAKKVDFFQLKGICQSIMTVAGVKGFKMETAETEGLEVSVKITLNDRLLGYAGSVAFKTLATFSIKEPVFYADLYWDEILHLAQNAKIAYQEVSKYPSVERDLALVLDKNVTYEQIEQAVAQAKISALQPIRLFDIFESEKLGNGKKSMAVNFTFLDENKTLTDKEIDGWMTALISSFKEGLMAEIRK